LQSKLQAYKDQIALANDRLIDSVTKVTELLRANQWLREEVDGQSRSLDQKEYELFSLNTENYRLRERIEVLETLVRGSSNQKPHTRVSSIGGRGGTIDKVYTELIGLRQHNRVLETRVKTLEKQNVEISKSLDFVGNNEPTRPVMMLASVNEEGP
jgi:chromosome segregation ATPase